MRFLYHTRWKYHKFAIFLYVTSINMRFIDIKIWCDLCYRIGYAYICALLKYWIQSGCKLSCPIYACHPLFGTTKMSCYAHVKETRKLKWFGIHKSVYDEVILKFPSTAKIMCGKENCHFKRFLLCRTLHLLRFLSCRTLHLLHNRPSLRVFQDHRKFCTESTCTVTIKRCIDTKYTLGIFGKKCN